MSANTSSMKLLFNSYLFTFIFILHSISAHALLTTTSTVNSPLTFSKSNVEAILGRKLKAKEKLGLWVLRRRLKKEQKQHPELFKNHLSPGDTTKCATIVFNSGAALKAQLIKVTDATVQFTRCGKTDTLSLSKGDIATITLYDGITLYQNNHSSHPKPKKVRKPSNNLGFIAILFAFSGVAFMAISPVLAVIFSLFALIFGVAGVTADNTIHKGLPAFGGIIGFLALAIHNLYNNRN